MTTTTSITVQYSLEDLTKLVEADMKRKGQLLPGESVGTLREVMTFKGKSISRGMFDEDRIDEFDGVKFTINRTVEQ